jgi:uncharacterized membrane protein YfhO
MEDIAETNHAMNDDYYFDGNFPNDKLCPYDNYKNMSTLNTYCGILSIMTILLHVTNQSTDYRIFVLIA